MLFQPIREEIPKPAKSYRNKTTETEDTKPANVGTPISERPEGDLINVSIDPEKNEMFN